MEKEVQYGVLLSREPLLHVVIPIIIMKEMATKLGRFKHYI